MNRFSNHHLGCTARVLNIDDNLESIDLIGRLLRSKTNCRLFNATLGRTGLRDAQTLHPDLILLDLNLPDMSGLALLRLLQMDSSTKDVPVVVLSAEAHQAQIDECLEAGASAYMIKPFDLIELLEVIHRLTEGGNEIVKRPGDRRHCLKSQPSARSIRDRWAP